MTRFTHRSLTAATGLLGACALVLGAGGASGAIGSPAAHAAGTASLNESGSLHLTSHTVHLSGPLSK